MDDPLNCACDAGAPRPAAEGIGRRTFLAQSALLAAAAMLASCVANADATAPSLSGSVVVKLSDHPELNTVGGIALVTIASAPFAIVRTATNTFVTLSRVCPHQGSTVNVSGSGFLCPNHGAQFSANGTWVGGQRTSSLQSYPTVYDSAAGTLTIG